MATDRRTDRGGCFGGKPCDGDGGRRVTVEWRPDDSNAGIDGRKDLI